MRKLEFSFIVLLLCSGMTLANEHSNFEAHVGLLDSVGIGLRVGELSSWQYGVYISSSSIFFISKDTHSEVTQDWSNDLSEKTAQIAMQLTAKRFIGRKFYVEVRPGIQAIGYKSEFTNGSESGLSRQEWSGLFDFLIGINVPVGDDSGLSFSGGIRVLGGRDWRSFESQAEDNQRYNFFRADVSRSMDFYYRF